MSHQVFVKENLTIGIAEAISKWQDITSHVTKTKNDKSSRKEIKS
jgi:hypothetical protein